MIYLEASEYEEDLKQATPNGLDADDICIAQKSISKFNLL